MKRTGMLIGLLAGTVALGGFALKPRAVSEAGAKFELLKGLTGTWVSEDMDGDERPDMTVTYRTTAGGSAVVETLFPGTPTEMMTIYHMDGGSLVCTHYCMLGNQPTLKIAEGGEANQIKLSMDHCTNLSGPDAMCMAEAVLTFPDKDHLKADWTAYEGKKRGETHSFELRRQTSVERVTSGLESYFIATILTRDGRPLAEQPKWEASKEAHFAQLGRLYDEGVMAAAGPFADFTGGTLIVRADSEEEARKLVEGDGVFDPGTFKITLRQWYASPSLFAQGG